MATQWQVSYCYLLVENSNGSWPDSNAEGRTSTGRLVAFFLLQQTITC